MLFYTDTLSLFHIANAAHQVDANIGKFKRTGSVIRKKKFAITFTFPTDKTRSSATWNQVGATIAALFELDPNMYVLSGSISNKGIIYDGVADFHEKTANVFRTWTKDDSPVNPKNPNACRMHRWDVYSRIYADSDDVSYEELRCRKCSILYYPNGNGFAIARRAGVLPAVVPINRKAGLRDAEGNIG